VGNERTDGMKITPLVMTTCGALWAVLFALMAWTLLATVENGKQLQALLDMKADVADHEQRLRALERP
jgi:hypothetical protein